MSPISPWLRHRGWLVVLGAFLIQVVGFGAIYSSSAFSAEIAASLGMDRADADLVMGLSLGSSFLVSAMSGSLADRFGPRPLALFGIMLVASGLALAALAQNTVALFLSYGLLLGLGVGLANVPALAAVQRWFLVKRGLATGLASAGMGVGTFLVPILKDLLSAFGDWRVIFLCCAALAILVGLAGALLLDAQPERHGMGPDGTRLNPASATRPAEGLSLCQALRSRGFQYALLGTLLVSIPVSAPLMLLVGSAEVRGLSHQQAIGLLGLVGAGSLSGRFVLGAAADRLGRRFSFLVICFALGLVMFAWAAARDAWSLCAFALIYGVLQGSFLALLPAFTADSFGSRAIGGLIGALYTSRGVALLSGLPLMCAGIAFFGAYEVSIVVCGLAGLFGAVLLCLARPQASGERKIAPAKPAVLATASRATAPAKTGQTVLALWMLSVLGLGTGMLAVLPRGAAAEALLPDTAIRAANLPITQARVGVRSFAVELAGGAGVFDMPEAAAHHPVPAVLILHDASGADGRTAAYAEHLLGADIAVLELLEGGSAAAGAALAALAADPRINSAQLGILGFGILAAETERADALGEILSQSDEFIGDFFGLIDGRPSTHPATGVMMDAASLVALTVVQHFKWLNNRRRPSQVCPALRPHIQVPGHAAYPSGHATQAFLIATSLAAIFPANSKPGSEVALQALAARIARNREIAGLHYPSDTAAGKELAEKIWDTLKDVPEFKVMSAAAKKEWEGIA